MTLKVELEIEVTGDCSFEDARDFFRYQFAGYSLHNPNSNPLINEYYDAEYDVTCIEIEEL